MHQLTCHTYSVQQGGVKYTRKLRGEDFCLQAGMYRRLVWLMCVDVSEERCCPCLRALRVSKLSEQQAETINC
jgi:hypothetical protein